MPGHARSWVAALTAGVIAAGCAADAERPTAELTRAQTLVDRAEQAGAQRYAAAELQQAREKLRLAEQAAEGGEAEEARRLAVEASLDAELAAARTTSVEAQRAAREVERSVEALRREASRTDSVGSPGERSLPAPPPLTPPPSPTPATPQTSPPDVAPESAPQGR